MDALFNNAGPGYLPSACKIVIIKCWTVHNISYDPPPLVRVSRLATTSSQGAQTQARGTGAILSSPGVTITTQQPPVLHSGSEQPPILSCVVVTTQAVSSPALELRLTASTPQKDSSGLDPAMQICSFV